MLCGYNTITKFTGVYYLMKLDDIIKAINKLTDNVCDVF